MILELMRQKGVLSETEYRQALAEMPNVSGMQKKVDQSFTAKTRRFFRDLFGYLR